MSECKSPEKSGPSNSVDLSSISSILRLILMAFLIPSKPATSLPPPLLMIGAKLRPGLNAKDIAARIISRQSEAGAPVGVVVDGSSNVSEAMEVIRMEEVVNAIVTEAKVDITVAPGVQVTVTGVGNYGAPVISQGATTAIASGDGIVS